MRSFLRFIFVVACFLLRGSDALDLVEKRDNVTLKVPIVAVPSQDW